MGKAERAQTGLERFHDRLDPDVVADIRKWRSHPSLNGLFASLLAHTDQTPFLDVYAEALMARHLLQHGCRLRFEVPTPAGKHCDFEVNRDGQQVYLHLKRLHGERVPPWQLSISPRLRYLERIKRPYIVRVRWHDDVSDRQMQHFVARAAAFITHARVGDELTIRDERDQAADEQRELGGVRIVAPWNGDHVSLAIGLPSGFTDEAPRIRRLLRRAYRQFMPRAMNVIIICSRSEADAEDFQSALLGSHIERWDASPPRGRRIAHGRAEDGFWHGGRYAESEAAGWFSFEPDDAEIRFRHWQRQDAVIEPPMQEMLAEILGAGKE